MYHRVADLVSDPHQLCVHPAEFRAQMQFIVEKYVALSLEELVTRVAERDVPDGAVAVTFDDGTVDALEVVAPILGEIGVPGTFFVNTERLDVEHESWWDELERIFLSAAVLPPAIGITLGGKKRLLPTHNPAERRATYLAIHHDLLFATLADREERLKYVVTWSGVSGAPRRTHRQLLGTEIRELAQWPEVAIGSHSTHHLFLPAQSHETRTQEIRGSKERLERLLDASVSLFSYPYGGHDPSVAQEVEAAGFAAAVTAEPRSVRHVSDVFMLPRLEAKCSGVGALDRMIQDALES